MAELGVPDGYRPIGTIALGYPADDRPSGSPGGGGARSTTSSTEVGGERAARRGGPADTDLDRLRHLAYADPGKLDDRRAIYEYQDPRPDFYGWILDQVDWPEEGRVLDLGCGPGSHLARLAERRPGLELVGADVSTGMLAAARVAARPADPVALDAGALPFDDDSFDVVMANHMLYHVADLDRTAAELRRVIGPAAACWPSPTRSTTSPSSTT